jgi:hypothetical protein
VIDKEWDPMMSFMGGNEVELKKENLKARSSTIMCQPGIIHPAIYKGSIGWFYYIGTAFTRSIGQQFEFATKPEQLNKLVTAMLKKKVKGQTLDLSNFKLNRQMSPEEEILAKVSVRLMAQLKDKAEYFLFFTYDGSKWNKIFPKSLSTKLGNDKMKILINTSPQ